MSAGTFIARALAVIGLVAISTDPAYAHAIDLDEVLIALGAYFGALVAFVVAVIVAFALGGLIVKYSKRKRP